jgi:predicted RND superfamily exporter protein
MNKISPLAKSFVWLLIPTILLFVWTKDLAQNNREYLFLNNDLKQSYNKFIQTFGNDDQLIIEIPVTSKDTDPVILKKVSAVTKVLSANSISNWITPEQTSRKKKPSEWTQFYRNFPKMDFKLATENSLFIVVQIPELKDAQQTKLYNELVKMPFVISMAGMGYTNYHLNIMSESIQQKLFPLLFILTLLASFYYYRNLEITLFVFINSLFATMIGLAILKLTYGEANILTTSVPLINFVTTQSLSIHIISGLFSYRGIGLTYKRKLTPMLLMVSSTIIGFFSLITSDIIAVKQFAIMTSSALLITTVFFLVSWRFFLKGVRFQQKDMKPLNLLYAPKFITKRMVYGFSIICLLLAVYTYPKLTTTVEALHFFPSDHRLVQDFERVETLIGGTPKLDIILEKKDHGDFGHNDLLALDAIQTELNKKLNEHSEGVQLISKASLIKNANYAYTGIKEIPLNETAAGVIFSQIPEMVKNSYIEPGFYHITLLSPTMSTEQYIQILDRIHAEISGINYTVSFNGLNYTLVQSQKNLVHSLLVSLGLSIVLVCFMVGVSFRDFKKLGHFIISNTPPITLTIALLYFSSTALNISTIKTFSISFGMIFDSTIHLLYNYKRKNLDPHIFQQTVLNPIYLSSFVTIISFAVFGFHEFIPIKQFGLLLAFLLLLGLLFDVLLLPVLEEKE